MFSNKKTMPLWAILTCLLWGSAFPTLKNTYRLLGLQPGDVYEKVQLAGMRFFLAAVLLLLYYTLKNKKLPKASLGDLKWFFLLGIFHTALQYYFFYNGLSNTTGVKGAILTSCGTFFVVILAHFYYKNDRLSIPKFIGLILGFGGIFIINLNKLGTSGPLLDIRLEGEGFLIMTGIISAIGTILAKNITKTRDPLLVTGWQMLLGSILLLTTGTVGTGGQILAFNTGAFLLYVYSALLSAFAFAIWYPLLRNFKASEVSMYKFLIPIFGSILSVVFVASEHFTILIVLGLFCASAGIYVVNRFKSKG